MHLKPVQSSKNGTAQRRAEESAYEMPGLNTGAAEEARQLTTAQEYRYVLSLNDFPLCLQINVGQRVAGWVNFQLPIHGWKKEVSSYVLSLSGGYKHLRRAAVLNTDWTPLAPTGFWDPKHHSNKTNKDQ